MALAPALTVAAAVDFERYRLGTFVDGFDDSGNGALAQTA